MNQSIARQRPVTVLCMPRMSHESVATWYERAIVADSLAAETLRQMNDSPIPFNSHARSAVIQRADNAETDLSAARTAYTKQFGTGAARNAAAAPSAPARTRM